MTAQKGKDLLLKVDSDGAGSFTTVAGLRARTLAFNAASVDITDQESTGRWRELLEGAGIKTARITGSGIFKDAGSDETLRSYFFNGTVRAFRVIVPELGTIEGPFQIASLEYAGQHDGEVSFDLQGQVRQCRQLPRLPARAGQRLHAERRQPPGQERRQEPVQVSGVSPSVWPAAGRCGGRRRPRGIARQAPRYCPSRHLCRA